MCARQSGSPTITKLNVVRMYVCTIIQSTSRSGGRRVSLLAIFLQQASQLVSAKFQIHLVNGFTEFTTYRDIFYGNCVRPCANKGKPSQLASLARDTSHSQMSSSARPP